MQLLRELRSLLAASDAQAIVLLRERQADLKALLGQQMPALAERMSRFDFASALSVLDGLADSTG